MALLGDVLLEITGAERINYGLLGNSEPALHAHVFPATPTSPRIRAEVRHSHTTRNAPSFDPERDGPLMQEISVHLSSHLA
jgi:hypothetical protein